MTPELAALLRMRDQSVLVMFGGVCTFAFNWYAFDNNPAIQRVMTWVPLLASALIVALEIASGAKA